MDSAATAAPPAGSAAADAAAARLHGPTSLTPTKASAAPSPGSAGGGEACHSYTATRTLLGQPRQVSGLACRDSNGQWQIISELPR
jgi:surface antigen